LGRFLQPDTVVPDGTNPQTWNRYSYVKNNPIVFNDPTGHWIESVLDGAFIAYDIYDISQNGLNWVNGLSLVADVACAILPIATGGGLLVRALAHAPEAAKVVSRADDIAKMASKVDEIVAAGKKAPVVIGESMSRVQEYAELIGAHYYKPRKIDPYISSIHESISKARNERWIKDMMRQGREIIDIGPNFPKRILEGASDWYEIERKTILKKGYENYTKVFERFSKTAGGVFGLDF